MSSSKKNHHNKEKTIRRNKKRHRSRSYRHTVTVPRNEEKNQNPDYEHTADLSAFHSVAPPGSADPRSIDAHKISIENSKYLGGDVEYTHLVKGLDYALLNKVRSEIDKKPDAEDEDAKSRPVKEDQKVTFRTATARRVVLVHSVYQWIVKPQTFVKSNEMFLPGRMSFIFNIEGGYSQDIPSTLHRSKADCPVPKEMVTVSVDGTVLERIAKIMSYLRLGQSGKVLKKKKKEKDVKGKHSAFGHEYVEEEKPPKFDGGMPKRQIEREMLPPPPPPPPLRKEHIEPIGKQAPAVVRNEEDDIFVGDGIDYDVPGKDMSQRPVSEDMEELSRNKEIKSYFDEPAYA